MTKDDYATFIAIAKNTIGGEYAAGYQRGLARHFHGDGFGDQAEHELLLNHDGVRGTGYQDGLAGKMPTAPLKRVGNQNARKDITRDAQLVTRCTQAQRDSYKIAAKMADSRLSEWVLSVLDAEIARLEQEAKKII